jgi:ATP-dependent Clp protease adaptor protein ClpS
MPIELSRAEPETGGSVGTVPEAESSPAASGPWCTVVWNDPVNLMSYVVFVFRRHFGYSRQVAESLMMQVHQEGRSIVSRGSRERMEIDVQAMHGYGLHATLEKSEEG